MTQDSHHDLAITPATEALGKVHPRPPPFLSPTPPDLERGPAERTNTSIEKSNFKTTGARALFDHTLLQPRKPILEQDLTWQRCAINTLKYSWLNLLFICVPISWALHFAHVSDTVVFVVSGLSIVPCAALLGFATEELAAKVGDTLGGLINCTCGNLLELIIAILALVKGEISVVQNAMVGSILSNCLLVLGCCFFAGGLRYHEQPYKIRSAQVNISMLGLSTLAIIIPAAFHIAILNLDTRATANEASLDSLNQTVEHDVRALSHGTAIILLIAYAGYLTFQLWTHAYLYNGPADPLPNAHDPKREPDSGMPVDNLQGGNNVFRLPSFGSSSSSSSSLSEDEVEHAQLTTWAAIAVLVIVTAIGGVSSEWLVSSIDGLTKANNISEEWVALILIPVISNSAEHVVAVTVSLKNKLDLSIQVAVGSSIQIGLFVFPVLIVIGWCIGQPLTFELDSLVAITLFIGMMLVQFAIGDGRTHWLEGFGLILVYVLIALVFWFYDPVPQV